MDISMRFKISTLKIWGYHRKYSIWGLTPNTAKPLLLIFLLGTFLFTIGCATLQEREDRYGSNPPIITSTYAKDSIRSGDTWKVYVNAMDQDGDMDIFVCSIMQDGSGPYPFDTIRIKPDQGKYLSGYLYLPASGFQDLWNVHIELSLYILDKAGHKSNEEVLELRFTSRASDEEVDQTIYDNRPLGPIKTDIFNLDIGDVSGGDFQVQ